MARESWVDRHCHDSGRRQLAGEGDILELISQRAPLPGILNRLCAAIDLQIGNVVSLVLLPDGGENHSCSVTKNALQLGLHLFFSADILSRDKAFLGTLEIYGCDRRRPTLHEYRLIERVGQLAAIVLQRHADHEAFEKPSGYSKDGMDGALERPRFIN